LVLNDREEPGVVPRLRNKVAGAAAHGLDGDVHAGPSRHDDDGEGRVECLELLEQLEAFLAAGRVARVVEIDEDEREFAGLNRLEDGGGRFYGFNLVTLGLEEEPERLEDVRLVVGDEDA